MKKILTLTAVLATASTSAYAQYIGGLDFVATTSVASDIAFDSGTEAANFTLNIQGGSADDNLLVDFGPFSGLSESGWAAASDTFSSPGGPLPAGSIGVTNVQAVVPGFAASTNLFGGTSAAAQGFDSAAGIAFGNNDSGIFTIDFAQGVLGAEIAFDVAALSTQSQEPGSFLVNGQAVNATASASNVTLSLGDLGAGESIVFQLTGPNAGFTFDNFQIAGTVVPEPSTYAAIAGALALGFVAYRRRRNS